METVEIGMIDGNQQTTTLRSDVSDDYRYRVVSRLRTKIENLEEDVEILTENREDLIEELREVVCED